MKKIFLTLLLLLSFVQFCRAPEPDKTAEKKCRFEEKPGWQGDDRYSFTVMTRANPALPEVKKKTLASEAALLCAQKKMAEMFGLPGEVVVRGGAVVSERFDEQGNVIMVYQLEASQLRQRLSTR